ncbi:hypothetical protein CLV40_11067 [Actinokineospora auranticolor]|uniref:Uncharacterized protein n=1 Tax=Actinokineospora auranticolor TaxID=155976 RepID=A0A2S6GMG2_9PSEU|nr:hypothetical protein CLV40_11067 [Actinokineospora auranticolor]
MPGNRANVAGSSGPVVKKCGLIHPIVITDWRLGGILEP